MIVSLHFAAVSRTVCALLVKVGRETYQGDLRDNGREILLGGSLANIPAAVRRVVPDVMAIASRMSPADRPQCIQARIG